MPHAVVVICGRGRLYVQMSLGCKYRTADLGNIPNSIELIGNISDIVRLGVACTCEMCPRRMVGWACLVTHLHNATRVVSDWPEVVHGKNEDGGA